MSAWRRPFGSTGDWEYLNNFWMGRHGNQKEPGFEYIELGDKAIDIMGRELEVGDRIAVAMTSGRSAEMAVGKIVSFRPVLDYYKEPTEKITIEVEWEVRSYNGYVKNSRIDASLRKYLKL